MPIQQISGSCIGHTLFSMSGIDSTCGAYSLISQYNHCP